MVSFLISSDVNAIALRLMAHCFGVEGGERQLTAAFLPDFRLLESLRCMEGRGKVGQPEGRV